MSVGPADRPSLVLRNAEVIDHGIVDVLVRGERITSIGHGLVGDEVIDCAGAALLPGLHDHHVHLLATAAATRSVVCGPPKVRDAVDLERALRSARSEAGWIRGVGYHESVAGSIDAAALDRWMPDRPVRIQHRSGAQWVLNSAALSAVGADESTVGGIERDAVGRPTGRLWRLDGWLGTRVGRTPAELGTLSRRLASYGITSVTDATPDLPESARRVLLGDDLAQHVTLLGEPVGRSPFKVVIADHDLPSLGELTDRLRSIRPRPVALHSITRVSLVLALAALEEIGVVAGDRIEHAAVAPPEVVRWMARLGVAVVTQPSLPALRGDDYVRDVDPDDLRYLWPYRSLLDAGVKVGCSSDAPYGDLSPWRSIAAAVDRRALSGREVTAGERVTAWEALRGYLGSASDPGGSERRVAVGKPATLTLLSRPLASSLADPRSVRVRTTLVDGRRVLLNGGEQ